MEYLKRAEEIKGFEKGQQPVTAQLPSGAAQKARPKGNGDGGGGGGGADVRLRLQWSICMPA